MTVQHAARGRASGGTERRGVNALEDLARRHRSLVVLARAGWLAKGVVYGLVGVLAFGVAVDRGGAGAAAASGASGEREASQTGAIGAIAQSAFGGPALWIVAAGLLLYVLWRVVSILLPAEDSATAWATRAGYLVSAIAYAVLALSAVSFALHRDRAASEDARIETLTRDLMGNALGRVAVGALGLVLVAVAIVFARRAVTADFDGELAGGIGPIARRHLVRLGQAGWLGRAAMVGLVGGFLVRAAVLFEPSEAEGLDGALRRLVQTWWGPPAVAAVGAGLVLYGAYCALSAPVQRLTSAGR